MPLRAGLGAAAKGALSKSIYCFFRPMIDPTAGGDFSLGSFGRPKEGAVVEKSIVLCVANPTLVAGGG
jgi:hypothetical protein